MPKNKAQRRIDKTAGSGARTVNIIGGGAISNGDVGQHALNSSKHTGTLAESQAPWAVTDTEFNAHTANINAHHNRQHSVTSTSDHTITADAFALLGATGANTLGLLYIASSGDGIDVEKSSNTFTIAADVSDFVGVGLEDDGSNNLQVDEDYDFAWTGDHTYTGSLSSSPFSSSDPISGFRIEADGDAWFSNLYATQLSIKTFISDVTLALQGSEVIVKSKAIVSRDFSTPATSATLYVYDLPGQPNDAVFEVGDYIRLRYVNRATGLNVGDVWGIVSAHDEAGDEADDEQSWTFTRTAGNAGQTIYSGMVALDYGASGDGYIILQSYGTDAPYMDVRTWTTTPAVAGNHTTIARIGTLDGITDAVYGTLSGEGIFTETAYLKGTLYAGGGDTVVGDQGLNIQAGTSSSGTWTNHSDKITISTDPMATQDETTTVAQIAGSRYDSDGTVYSQFNIRQDVGVDAGVDAGQIYIETSYTDVALPVPIQFSRILLNSEAGEPSITLFVQGQDSSAGGINLYAPEVMLYGHLFVDSDGVFDIGTSDKRIRRIYADEIVAGTTSSEDTGHNHDDRYYTKSQVDSDLSGKSDTIHTHAGLVTTAGLTATLADYVTSSSLTTTLTDYDTSAEVDAKIAGLSADTHTHNLADLAERNYSSLQSRGHVLADASGLGADHTVSGLTTGHALRATGATTARFMQMLYTDLGSRTHNVISEHSITAGQYSVVGTPTGANTLTAWATASDGTAGNVLLRTDANGDLTVNDLIINDLTAEDAVFGGTLTLGDYWQIDASGNIKSTDPSYAYADPEQGTLITPDGRIVALDIDARSGRFRAAVYEIDSTVVGPSSEIWTYAGGAMTASATTIDSSGSIAVAVQDGRLGHYRQFQAGETIRLRGPAISTLTPSVGGDAFLPYWAWQTFPAYTDDYAAVADVYLTIDDFSDNGTYFTYACTWAHGANNVLFPTGTPVIGYGNASDSAKLGAMRITSDANGPRLTAFEYGDNAWTESGIVALGNIGSSVIGWLDSDERGLITGTSIEDQDEFSGIVASNKRMLIQNPDLVIKENGLIRLKTADDGLHLGLYNEESTSFYDITGRSRITFTDSPDSPDSAADGWAMLTTETQRRDRSATQVGGSTPYVETSIQTKLEVQTDVGTADLILVASTQYAPGGITGDVLEAALPAAIALRSDSSGGYITFNALNVVASDAFQADSVSTGTLRISSIPTSATGLRSGDVYSDSGTLKIVS